MPQETHTVMGVHAPRARLTRQAARYLIVILCLPILAICVLIDTYFIVASHLR